MVIPGDVFLLRHFQASDKKALAKHANNKKISDNLRDRFPYPYTEEDAEVFIKSVLENNGPARNWVIEIGSEAAGAIGIIPGEDVFRLNAEIGYWLAEEHWGKGIMTNVIKATVRYIFNSTDFRRIFAVPFSTSLGSIRALEKAGFSKDATIPDAVIKNGKVLGYHIYSITSSSNG